MNRGINFVLEKALSGRSWDFSWLARGSADQMWAIRGQFSSVTIFVKYIMLCYAPVHIIYKPFRYPISSALFLAKVFC